MSSGDPLLPQRTPRQRAEQQRAQNTVRLVLDATIARLQTSGETGVNIKEIAAETGVSYGAIYHHFKDRDGLIHAAQFERLRNQPGGDIVSLGSALDVASDLGNFVSHIKQIADDIAAPSRGDVRLVRSSVIASSLNNPELRAALVGLESEVMEELTGLIERAQKLGIADPALDSKATAVFIEALSYGIVLMEFMENPPSQRAVSDMLFRSFLSLLAPST